MLAEDHMDLMHEDALAEDADPIGYAHDEAIKESSDHRIQELLSLTVEEKVVKEH